ncbi:MAG: Gfo/Idh/MocA family oxidoreductase [Kiritimatiellae bacterium]|nr:Gfo/Idh/MocA family oxidoreductase [Kiritimatiellia bacterium]
MKTRVSSRQPQVGRPISRRLWLKHAAAATAAVGVPVFVPASALGGENRPAPSNRLTLAIIGIGSMGMRNLQGFLTENDCQITAVCDVDAARRQEGINVVNQHYNDKGCAQYNDFREVIARRDIDLLCLSVPDHWHSIPAIMGVAAGKDIYGEKPLAYTVAEGRAMAEAVKQFGRVWQTGSWQRSVPHFRFACELVRSGRIGRLKCAEVGIGFGPTTTPQPVMPVPEGFDYEMWLGPAPWAPYTEKRCHFNFRWISDYGGGQVTDWGAHHIDIAQWGMDTEYTGPVEVEGAGKFPTEGLWDTAITYRFECRYANGLTMVVASEDVFKNGVRFIGDKGWIHVDRNGVNAEPRDILRERLGNGMSRNLKDRQSHRRNFLDCVRSRAQPVSNIEVAQRSITVGHLGNIAMQLGRKIRWNAQTESIIGDISAQQMLSRAMRSPWAM